MIEKLNRHYSMTNPASVYDEEALTALELAARTTGKVNEMVDKVNGITQDVEKAVDNVLRGGSFDVLIDAKLDNIGKRFENLSGNLTAGSTTFDAEIVDARVDSSGYRYSNLGAAIRGLEAQTKREINRFVSVNRLNPDTVIRGYIDPVHGVINESVVYVTTDYISIAEGERIGLFDKDMCPRQIRFVAAYDKNKQLLNDKGATDVLAYAQKDDVGFVRISYKETDTAKNFMVANADTMSFSKYGDGTLVNTVIPENVTNATEDITYTNRYHTTDKEVGVYANYLTGMLHENPEYFTTGFIRVHEGERLSLFNKGMSLIPVRMGIWYDRDGKFMSGFSVESTVISVPVGACYVRFSVKNEYDGELMLAENDAHKFIERGNYALRKGVSVGASGHSNKVARYTSHHVAGNTPVYLHDFPKYINYGFSMSIFARFPYGSWPQIYMGKGGPNDGEYGSWWTRIAPLKTFTYAHYTEDVTEQEFEHNVMNMDFYHIVIDVPSPNHFKVTVRTNGTGETHTDGSNYDSTFTYEGDTSACFAGVPFFSSTSELFDVSFSIYANALERDVWLFGDSYLGGSSDRIVGQLANGFGVKNMLVDSMPGIGSIKAFDDLQRAFLYGKPKTLVWYVGFNDDYDVYSTYLPKVIELCEANNVDVVINRLPSTGTYDRTAHAALAVTTGKRIVDSWSVFGEDITWNCYGFVYLSSDVAHPTTEGAIALAARLLTDVPELLDERSV